MINGQLSSKTLGKTVKEIVIPCSNVSAIRWVRDNHLDDKLKIVSHQEIVTDEAVAATCTRTGLTEGSHCEHCGEIFVPQEETELAPHSWVKNETTGETVCSVCGTLQETPEPAFTGLQEKDGKWVLFLNGAAQTNYNGLYLDEQFGWWLIRDGIIDFGYNGLWNDPVCGWWLITDGAVNFGYTGLWNDPACGWWMISGGAVDFGYTGLWNDPICGWWLINGGAVDFGYTGLWNDPACGWWLIDGGTVAFGYSGIWNDPIHGTWMIQNGMIDWNAVQ